MTLWNKTYDVPVCFVTPSVEEDVNEKQVESMEKFRSVIAEQKNKIEELIMQYLESDDDEHLQLSSEELDSRFMTKALQSAAIS